MKHLKNLLILGIGVFALSLLMTSCSDTDDDGMDDATVENFVDGAVFGIQARGNVGKMGCYEFVFPIEISFPDESITSVEDYKGLRVAIAEFIIAYQDTMGVRPQLVYPLEITTKDGEIISVEDSEEMKVLRKICRKKFYTRVHNRHHHRGDRCFKLVFPLDISFPDETTFTAEDKMALKEAVRTWKKDNPDVEGRPEFVYPVTVEFKDGSTATLESKAGFRRLRDACSED